jgi:hypothetical protein
MAILPEDPSGKSGDRCLDTETKEVHERETKIAPNSADTVTRSEQLAEMEEPRQDVLDARTVKENDTDEPGLSTTEGVTEPTGENQTDMDTDDDKAATVKVTAVARPITGSIKDGQRDQPPAPPAETAAAIKERHHVSKTLSLLSSPSYDKHTIIVSAFDTCITKADFARL